METNSGTNENSDNTWPGAGLDHCLTGYHNTEYLTDGIKIETDYMNQFHKLINKTKDIEFGSEYQFTLRRLEKKENAKNSPDAGSWKRLLEINITEVN